MGSPPAVSHLGAVVELLAQRPGALVLTGAGMSTESGIPDYRGPDGLRRVTPMSHGEFVGTSAARQRYWARSYIGWARFHRTEIVLWREPWRLPAFWTVLRPYCPESIRRVRFYARRASGIPEEWNQPPLEHRLLKELVVTPGP